MKLQLFLLAVLIASTLVHELGHVIVGSFWGYRCVGVRWLPPGVHLRGPRGAGGIAPPLEAIAVAIAGPLASVLWSGVLWYWFGPFTALLGLLCGGVEWFPFIPHTDGHRIWCAISMKGGTKNEAATS